MRYGVYEVVGPREYRGHKTGTVFTAVIDRPAAQRAIRRGDITFLGFITPSLEPGSFTFPQGWLSSQEQSDHEAPRGASFIERSRSR